MTADTRRAPVFAALGAPTRLALLGQMRTSKPMSISALTAGSGITRQAVSKHLRVLSTAGLVRHHREGREQLYELDAAPLRDASDWLEQYRQHWEQSLDRLEDYLQTLQSKE